ncbi:hypothetical protein D3C73_777180 [compost metagenome]
MHAFPPATDLQFLVGLEVGQICLDPWSTQLRFADGGRISIEGPFDHRDAQGQLHTHQTGEGQDHGAVFFRDLIQQQITFLESEPKRLTLVFGNGARLRIVSEKISYEGGQIYPPGREDEPIIF